MFDCGALRPSCRRFLNLVLRHGQDLSENCLSVDHGHSAPRMEADAKRPISARSRRAGLAEDPVRRLRPPSTPLGGRTNSLDPVRRSRRTTSRQVLSGDGDFTRGSLAGFFCRNFCKAPRVLAFGKRLGKMSAASESKVGAARFTGGQRQRNQPRCQEEHALSMLSARRNALTRGLVHGSRRQAFARRGLAGAPVAA